MIASNSRFTKVCTSVIICSRKIRPQGGSEAYTFAHTPFSGIWSRGLYSVYGGRSWMRKEMAFIQHGKLIIAVAIRERVPSTIRATKKGMISKQNK